MSFPKSSPRRSSGNALRAVTIAIGAAGLLASPAAALRVTPVRTDLPIPAIDLPAIPLPLVPLPSGVAQPKISAPSHPKALLAHTPSGAIPNGPTSNPVISGDGRIARFAAYSSRATDIVAGAGPASNVYLVERQGPFDVNGTPWKQKRTILVSQGIGGPANGDSWGGSFDGYRYTDKDTHREKTIAPKCFAFVSAASNLVAGDTNGAADVFVRNTGSGRLTRIKSSAGATAVDLDGLCQRVAFVAGGVVKVAAPDGTGKAATISGAGASAPELSANGKTATFERDGGVWVWQNGRTRRLAAGENPSSDQWGRFITYHRGQDLFIASLVGSVGEKRLTSPLTHDKVFATTAPSMTAGGHFVLFGIGPYVDSNVYRNFALCPVAGATVSEVMGSPHGNYAVYTCSSGESWLSYIGARRAGDA